MAILEQFNAKLTELLGPLGPMILVGVLGLTLIVVTLGLMATRKPDPMEKLRDQTRGRQVPESKQQAKLRSSNSAAAKLEKFSNFLEPQDEKELSSSRLKMMQAGYRSRDSVRTFHAIQFGLGMGLLVLGVLMALVQNVQGEVTPLRMMFTVMVPGMIGYYGPKYWVERRRQARQQEIIDGFPDSLDMMLVCVEAGQSLDQSILRVAVEMKPGYPALAEEFQIVGQEVKAGKDRITVLKDMSERCGVPDVSSFVTVLVQSATFGTSIGEALRVYASEMRDKRVMRAEEKANVLPTKLTLGTMMFTVPPLMIILIGPSVYGIVQVLSP